MFNVSHLSTFPGNVFFAWYYDVKQDVYLATEDYTTRKEMIMDHSKSQFHVQFLTI